MTKLLIIENEDQDQLDNYVVIMVVPTVYNETEALESSGLERPTIAQDISLVGIEHALAALIDLGEYRGFMG